MVTPLNKDLTLRQGSSFDKKFNWYGAGKMIREIKNITPGCPTRITITAHGLPAGADTPVYIGNVKGTRDVNTDGKEIVASYVDADNFDVPTYTRGKTYQTGTGCVHYFLPTDLTDYIARMDIREEIDDTTTLVSLTSVGGDIVLNAATAEIQILISDEVTAALDFESGVYDLELEDAAGNVTPVLEGEVTFIKEVTRP